MGWDSEQEVWSRARGCIRLQHTEEATVCHIQLSILTANGTAASMYWLLPPDPTLRQQRHLQPYFWFILTFSMLQATHCVVLSRVVMCAMLLMFGVGQSRSLTVNDPYPSYCITLLTETLTRCIRTVEETISFICKSIKNLQQWHEEDEMIPHDDMKTMSAHLKVALAVGR